MGILLKPGDPEWKAYQEARQTQLERIAQASDKATEAQWQMVDFAIKNFIGAYPRQWAAFQEDLKLHQTKYSEATTGGLKQAHWRNTAAFPIAYVWDVHGIRQEKSLLAILQKIIPHLTHKNSINYAEFLRRYPYFRPSEKTNVGTTLLPAAYSIKKKRKKTHAKD